jgi:predicted nucleic acid-binding protein
MNCWTVSRNGRALSVNVDRDAVSKGEGDAIVLALSSEASVGDFDVVRVTGPMLGDPPKGTLGLLRALGAVAKRYGKRLEIGPI